MKFITRCCFPLTLSVICQRCKLLQNATRCSLFHSHRVLSAASTAWVRLYSSSRDEGDEPDLSRHSTLAKPVPTIPDQARVVICGGGVVGLPVAYHLAEKGWTDVVVLEQGSLTCGTTFHAAGLVGRMRSSRLESKLCDYSASLYKQWESEGDGVGWKQCGSLNVAQTLDRMIALKRQHEISKTLGMECHVVTPSDIKKISPMLKVDDLQGGLWIPGDGKVTGPDVAMVFSRKAKAKDKCMTGIPDRVQHFILTPPWETH